MNPQHTARRFARSARGFTLLEVMIVIVIILAILGIVGVNLMGAKKKADVGVAKATIKNIQNALKAFSLDFNRYPMEDGEGLAALWDKSVIDEADQGKWREGGYLDEKQENDAWGTPYIYRLTTSDDAASGETSGEPFILFSAGPDKQEGTSDDVYAGDTKPGEGGSGDDFGPPAPKGS